MYAIIKAGGKQFRVKKGDVIDIDLIEGEAGKAIELKEVIFFNDGEKSQVGIPVLKDFSVHAEIVGPAKGPKITSLRYKPRQYRKFGHRQHYTRIRITDIHTEKSSKKTHSKG